MKSNRRENYHEKSEKIILFNKSSLLNCPISLIITAAIFLFLFVPSCGTHNETKPWSFGVVADTQWTPSTFADGKYVWGYDPEGKNPNSVALSIISQINKKFIENDVKFVIQVGDITDWGTNEAIATRASASKELYDAGIGYFCMRGNHETYNNFYFPEAESNNYGINAIKTHFPQHRGLSDNLFGAVNFSSPSSDEPGLEKMADELNGISYAFDYGEKNNDATFVIIDPWATQTQEVSNEGLHASYGYSVGAQQKWISSRLDLDSRSTRHAFVFTHQPLIAQNHPDSPFGPLDSSMDDQNTFFSELEKNRVAFYIAGHDHIHNRSIVTSPDGRHTVEQLICAPACPKFYSSRPNDYEGWRGQKQRSAGISQELNNIGYYIFTINGPHVTVDYYADSKGGFIGGKEWPDGSGSLKTPEFDFVKKESWSFNLHGKSFPVRQGESYSVVQDSYNGTTARILFGKNSSTSVNDLGEPLMKTVKTGWMSDGILTLTGLAEPGEKTADTYTLSLTSKKGLRGDISKHMLLAKDSDGRWVNAVDLNHGGTKNFVKGPCDESYSLGTYGIDTKSNTVWAVIDHEGLFTTEKQ